MCSGWTLVLCGDGMGLRRIFDLKAKDLCRWGAGGYDDDVELQTVLT